MRQPRRTGIKAERPYLALSICLGIFWPLRVGEQAVTEERLFREGVAGHRSLVQAEMHQAPPEVATVQAGVVRVEAARVLAVLRQ